MPPKAAPAAAPKPAAAKPAAAVAKPAAARPAAPPAAKPASKPAAASSGSSAAAKKPAAASPTKPAASAPAKGAKHGKGAAKGKAAAPGGAVALAGVPTASLLMSEEERQRLEAEEEQRLEAERAELAARIQAEEARIREKVERKKKRREDRSRAEKTLLAACFDDELEKVRAGIERGVRVECRDHEGNSPLSEAACAGADEVVRYLLEETAAEVDARNSKGRTPLFRAAFGGKAGTVRLLLDAGADPSTSSDSLEGPAQVAATQEIKEALEAWKPEDVQRARAAREAALAAKGMQAGGGGPGEAGRTALQELLYDTEEEEKAPSAPGRHRFVVEVGMKGLPDVLDKAGFTGRCVLLVDPTGLGASYLSYRDTNYLRWASARDLEVPSLRLALLGGLRYGKPVVIDAADAPIDVEFLRAKFDAVYPGLLEKVLDLSVALLDDLQAFLRHVLDAPPDPPAADGTVPPPLDRAEYAFEKYSERNLAEFRLILVTKRPDAPESLSRRMFVVCTA
eukprot:tig00000640_g2780.t1